MFQKLQQKWKVTSLDLFLILCTFAVTGTSTAYVSRMITGWVGFDDSTFWLWKFLLRAFILVFGYQGILLTVSVFFGQFRFFWNYEKKILRRLRIYPKAPVRLAILASGKGSNVAKIIDYFRHHNVVKVVLVLSNRKEAGVLEIAKQNGINTLLINKQGFFQGDEYLQEMVNAGVTHIVLAGFLWKVPEKLIQAFSNKIINIHPALLPKHGGKGMYGTHVHAAVLAAGDPESGITVHRVDEEYDHGKTLFQAKIRVDATDTPDTLADKIRVLEHQHYPAVIEKWSMK